MIPAHWDAANTERDLQKQGSKSLFLVVVIIIIFSLLLSSFSLCLSLSFVFFFPGCFRARTFWLSIKWADEMEQPVDGEKNKPQKETKQKK
jgi:hypothetical protein